MENSTHPFSHHHCWLLDVVGSDGLTISICDKHTFFFVCLTWGKVIDLYIYSLCYYCESFWFWNGLISLTRSKLIRKKKCRHTSSHWTYHHHRHHVTPSARISLTLSCHPSLSSIASGRSLGLHPVSIQNCCM